MNPPFFAVPMFALLLVWWAIAMTGVSATVTMECEEGEHETRHNTSVGYELSCVKDPPVPFIDIRTLAPVIP